MTALLPTELHTIRDVLRHAVSRFEAAGLVYGHGTDNAWDEAVWLVTDALHLPLDRLEVFLDARLSAEEKSRLAQLMAQRICERVPLPYLLGKAWLAGHSFRVDRRVIVPRSFLAELITEQFAPWLADPQSPRRILDLCTGSGCLAILAALAFPRARVDGIDLSNDALAVATENIRDYGLQDQVHLFHSDLFDKVPDGRYDIILSNPPYVTESAMAELPPEFRHEPALALAAGDDGMDIVRRIIAEAPGRLTDDGLLLVEIGHNRDLTEAAFPDLPFTWLDTHGGNDHVFLLHAADLPQLHIA